MSATREDPRQVTFFDAIERRAREVDPWAHIYCDPSERIGPTRPPAPLGPLALASLATRTPRGRREKPPVAKSGRST